MSANREPEELSREAQLELLDQLLGDYRDRLKELTKSPNELEGQLQKIESSLHQHAEQLSATEAAFQEAAGNRRELRKKLEESRDRRNEVGALQERFSLLDQHYVSDIERLRAIEEGGTLFGVLGPASCPLCGAEPAHHRVNTECDGNIDAVERLRARRLPRSSCLGPNLLSRSRSCCERARVSTGVCLP